MADISDPRTDIEGLDDLEPLWTELHHHHLAISKYMCLVQDVGRSWSSRLAWYRRLLADGGSYLTATDDHGRLIGYAMIGVETGPDDTFEVKGGIAEVVTLVVTHGLRSTGVGESLLSAAEDFARDRGFDTVKIAVMHGNAPALGFYEANGYVIAEQVLYRRLDDG